MTLQRLVSIHRDAGERLISWGTHMSWLAERRAHGRWKPSPWLAPYIGVVARLPVEASPKANSGAIPS